jgi:cyclin-dependent kinase regulatory subunit CKS1
MNFPIVDVVSRFIYRMSSHQTTKPPRYSSSYEDDMYQYRHVILDKGMVSLIPKNRLMDECEWRALGIKQGPHWEHYLIHKPEPFVLMFRRLLKYRVESDPLIVQQNTHFPTTRIPASATMNYPLGDSTNTKNRNIGLRVAVNTYKMNNSSNLLIDDMNESGFESHCDG